MLHSLFCWIPKIDPIKHSYNWWEMLAILVLIILISNIKRTEPKKLKQLITAFINNRYLDQLMRENGGLTTINWFSFFIIFLVSVSIFIFRLHMYSDAKAPISIVLLVLGILSYYSLKIATLKITGYIFDITSLTNIYVFNVYLFNIVASLFMIPIVIGILFIDVISTNFLYLTGMLIPLLLVFYKLIKLINRNTYQRGVSNLYIIMYLCTLEILPLIVIYTLFIGK